jgi:hypothetical protein
MKIGLNHGKKNDVWFNFPLMYRNNVIGKAETICPNTIKLLKSLKNINIAGYSLLIPNSKIEFHTDDTGPTFNSMAFNMKLSGGKSDLKIKDKNNIYITPFSLKNGTLKIYYFSLFFSIKSFA